MELVKKETFRLCDLVETQIEGKLHYERAPFSDDLSYLFEEYIDFNRVIDADDLDEMLNDLVDATYGEDSHGHWFAITGDMPDCDGIIHIKIKDDERLEIQDITDRILDLSEYTRLFILVKRQLTEYKWVVADPKGTVYSG
jgi:hypothetical protein